MPAMLELYDANSSLSKCILNAPAAGHLLNVCVRDDNKEIIPTAFLNRKYPHAIFSLGVVSAGRELAVVNDSRNSYPTVSVKTPRVPQGKFYSVTAASC